MKRGDIVVPTWGRRRRKAKLQHKDIGIVVATDQLTQTNTPISVKVVIVRASRLLIGRGVCT